MNTYQQAYINKRVTPTEAVKWVRNGQRLLLPYSISQPPALLHALNEHLLNGSIHQLEVYYMRSPEAMQETLFSRKHYPKIHFKAFGLTAFDRALREYSDELGTKVIDYVPSHFSELERLITEHFDIDIFMLQVAPMDAEGRFNLGPCGTYNKAAAAKAKVVIAEVNHHMPIVMGDNFIHVNDVHCLVEQNTLLTNYPSRPATPVDYAIAEQIHEHVHDGTTLQLGVGGMVDVLTDLLDHHNDLGVHSELMTPGFIRLIKSGVINGSQKTLHRNKHVFTACFGTEEMYRFMHKNPDFMACPASYVNDPRVIAQNKHMISVNSIIEVDLLGQINCETIAGRQYNNVGGQNDFIRGSYWSPGGKAFLAFHSTARNGKISRIVPHLGSNVASNSRNDTHYLVTEYGMVNLKGLSTSERAGAIIKLAAPAFRDSLEEAAKREHLI